MSRLRERVCVRERAASVFVCSGILMFYVRTHKANRTKVFCYCFVRLRSNGMRRMQDIYGVGQKGGSLRIIILGTRRSARCRLSLRRNKYVAASILSMVSNRF